MADIDLLDDIRPQAPPGFTTAAIQIEDDRASVMP